MTATPDPFAFTLDVLASRGALVEAGPEGGLVLLPPHLRDALGLPDEVYLAPSANGGREVACGYGSPLFERLTAEERTRVPVVAVRLFADPPRASQARALAGRFVVRNGVSEVLDVAPGEALYVAATFAYVAEADDRWEGTVTVWGHAEDGSVPDASFARQIDPVGEACEEDPLAGAGPVPGATAARIAGRAARAAREAVAPVVEGVVRRHARDHARIVEYFDQMIAEARSPRRTTERAAIEAKVARLAAERDAKLRELGPRYALRVTLSPAALVRAVAPVVSARLRVRRRKASRELIVRLPANAQALDRLACDGCPGATAHPILCDDHLHVLCAECAPRSEGRPVCPACG